MKIMQWLLLSLTFILSAGLAGPAAAAPAHLRCTGSVSNLVIRGDLIVPEGEICQIIGVTVRGHVRVQQRSTLEVIDSRIEGALSGTGFELVKLSGASVGERIRLTDGVSAWLEQSAVGGDIRLIDTFDTRVLDAQLAGDLVVRGAREQVQFCGTSVEGNARFASNKGWLQLGGDLATCAANEVQGSLRVHHNQADITIANNVVAKNLVCAANDPAPIVDQNQVGGTARGQCGAGEAVDPRELDGAVLQ